MTKNDRLQIQRAVNCASSHPAYAASTICCVANSQRTQASFSECFRLIDTLKLRDHIEVINGAILAKQP